jgi:hypothetical protein
MNNTHNIDTIGDSNFWRKVNERREATQHNIKLLEDAMLEFEATDTCFNLKQIFKYAGVNYNLKNKPSLQSIMAKLKRSKNYARKH